MTRNPDAVRGCEFIGNVRPATATSNPIYSMRLRTDELGGNVLFIVTERPHTGEAYRCKAPTISSDDPPPVTIAAPPLTPTPRVR